MNRDGIIQKLRDISRKIGITWREFGAIFSPYCGERVNFRRLPNFQDLFQRTESDEEDLSPEECHKLLLGLIPRGLIRRIKDNPQQRGKKAHNPMAQQKGSLSRIGDLVFTRKGYMLHRSIIRALFGYGSLKRYDAFTQWDLQRHRISHEASDPSLCRCWLSLALLPVPDNEIYDSLMKFPVEVSLEEEPEFIGCWKPSPMLTLRRGFRTVIRFRRRKALKLHYPEEGLSITFSRFWPIEANGRSGDYRIFFYDYFSYVPRSGCREFSSGEYQWRLSIERNAQSENAHPWKKEDGVEARAVLRRSTPLFQMKERSPSNRNRTLTVLETMTVVRQGLAHFQCGADKIDGSSPSPRDEFLSVIESNPELIMPFDVFGSIGGGSSAEGTLTDLVKSMPYLYQNDGLPTFARLNSIFRSGEWSAGMSGGARWRPFEIGDLEYHKILGMVKEANGDG